MNKILLVAGMGLIGLLACKKENKKDEASPRFATVEEAQAHLLATRECRGCDLNRVELAGVQLAGADLEGANLQGCDFNGADLSGANFKGARMKRCDLSTAANLRGADFRGADLTLAAFFESDLEGAQFRDAIMPDGQVNSPCPSELSLRKVP